MTIDLLTYFYYKAIRSGEKNMLNVKPSSTIITAWIAMLMIFSVASLFFSTITRASEQLDIRADEAADQCDADIAQIRVTVNNVGSGGILSVELYHDPKNFLSSKGRTRRIRIPATEEMHIVCFNVEKHGTYAVAAYHDIDGDRKLKRRWNKMPKEPFGLSNNPKLVFGFPKFSKSAFTTEDLGADITINLQEI
jgi:uncharacterized protein (DUF2141 family)